MARAPAGGLQLGWGYAANEGKNMDRNADIELNPDYWDCECVVDYIHHRQGGNLLAQCSRCGAYEVDQPDSRATEVEAMLRRVEREGQGR